MLKFCCPVCKEELNLDGRTYKCIKNHCFDCAKQGYVNLLQSNKSKSKRHGDDKLMIEARTRFLNTNFYKPLCDLMCEFLKKYVPQNASVLDAGCGDCYYTEKIEKALADRNASVVGVDISKSALIAAAKRSKSINLAVASVFSLPVGDLSCDAVLNVFSPFAPEEYARVLKSGGVLLRVIPLENHLFSLKKAIYDNPLKNPEESTEIDGFTLAESQELKYSIELKSNEQIESLFKMTPYYYKTSRTDQQKVEKLSTLQTEIEFCVLVYKKDNCDKY
ncbi:methyltransferase domain-containing protein [Eubacterium sp. OM08-24]|uniref:putative RNA methyltransferase n=1 Tax=Eubacterium sp. OM08-24 TaxID=2292352 RepID=UPI000E4402D7|nr:methyltransferase domain-containing protein [Eubacterium sp. OM08-24]RGM16944.1 methyltransferase domain-containing protein [Eubacterium sp. OM08-24]